MEKRINTIGFWVIATIIVFVCFIVPIFLVTCLSFGEEEKIYINKDKTYEQCEREAFERVYAIVNARLNKDIEKYRASQGFIDELYRQKRETELKHIQIYLSRVSPFPKNKTNKKLIKVTPIPLPIPDPIPTPILPDNGNNGNGLGDGQGNNGNNNGQGNGGTNNGNGTGNNDGNNGNGNGLGNGQGNGGNNNGNNDGDNGNGTNNGNNRNGKNK